MMGSIVTDNWVDFVPIFHWTRSICYDHIWVLTRSMYMDMPISEKSLEYAGDISIDLLHSVESALSDTTREWWYLIDPDDSLIRDDEEIEFIVDPWEQYECEKQHPIDTHPTPEYGSTEYEYEVGLHHPDDESCEDETEYISNLERKYDPMTMEHHDNMFSWSDLGCCIYGFGHVIFGGLK